MSDSVHSRSVNAEPLAHKDKNAPAFVPPSHELAKLVMRLRGQRPVWRIGNLAAPGIEWLAAPGPDGPIAVRPLEVDRDRRPYFRAGTLLALETDEPLAFELLQPAERKQLRSMYAAIMRDVQGSSLDEIVDALGAEFVDEHGVAHPEFGKRPGFADQSAARRQVRAGRELWRRLPAWPWSWFPDGKPPRDWRTAGPDAILAAALESWVTSHPILPTS